MEATRTPVTIAFATALAAVVVPLTSCTIGTPVDERIGWPGSAKPSPTSPGGTSGSPGDTHTPRTPGDPGGGGGGGGGGTPGTFAPASAPLRRLTQEEINNTIRDLFAGITVPSIVLNDGQGKGYDGDVARQTPSDLVVDQLRTGTIAVAAAAAARKDLLLSRQPSSDPADQRAVGHDFVASFGPRVMRRPLEQRELDAYDGLFDATLAANDFDVALEVTIEAMLQAPSFVYRVELGTGDSSEAPDTLALGPYEMASRLSYLLWETMPDQQLFDAAAANQLSTPDQLEAQARRMLADPKAKGALRSFARQWLDLDKVLAQNKDAATYPAWNDALAASLRREADEMITEAVFGSGDAKLRTLLTTTTTRVDAQLAGLYGIPAPAHDWDLVELPGSQRAGLITQGAFLAGRAHAVYPSPVLRGVYVLDRFLCQAPPPPGGAVTSNPPAPADPSTTPTTNRQRYAEHTANPACQTCHVTIDGIGMGLEGYDAIGRYRTTDNGYPVDDSGDLEATGAGGAFHGGPALAEILANSPMVEDCVARHWMTLMRGRAEEGNDAPQIDEVSAAFEGADGDLKELLVAMVKTLAFRTIPKVST